MKFTLTFLFIVAITLLSCVGCGTQEYTIVAHQCSVKQEMTGVRVKCPDGTESFVSNGAAGLAGANALILSEPSGTAGCTSIYGGTDKDHNGLLNFMEITMTTQVCDGQSAQPIDYPSYVDLCDPARNWSEIALKIGNDLIASMSEKVNGQNTRLVRLIPGNYRTTDGYSCSFSINLNGEVVH